ncbi:MAG: hypothetical protein ACE5OW_00090 [Candidatus Bathyarchaeia archaeon]
MAINTFVQSIHLVYIIILLVLGVLIYATSKHESGKNSLRDLWVLGSLSIILYPLIDYFLEAKLSLVTYLTNDPRVIVTPIYILLYWVFGVLLFGYWYYRMLELTNKVWMAGLATGFFAAMSATFIENLFNAMGFYYNTPSYYMIWHIPVYIPLGYMFVFSLIPLYLRHKYISGLLLYGFTGLGWYLFYHIVSWLALWL